MEEERLKQLRMKRKQRRETTRKIQKKTKKGQPIMSNMIDVLLEKIEKDVAKWGSKWVSSLIVSLRNCQIIDALCMKVIRTRVIGESSFGYWHPQYNFVRARIE